MYKLLDNKNLHMEVRRYNPSDKEQMDSWYAKRNMPVIPDALLPPIGFIVDKVAAGFLYQTDGGVAFVENYITSPDANYSLRDEALDRITIELVKYAEEQGFEKTIAITTAQGIYSRALKLGFEDYGNYRVLNKSLKVKGN